jgi:hypothetical protein
MKTKVRERHRLAPRIGRAEENEASVPVFVNLPCIGEVSSSHSVLCYYISNMYVALSAGLKGWLQRAP